MNSSPKKILIKSRISEDLAMRDSVNSFFKEIEKLPEDEIIIDFKGIKTITRSFAHQYLLKRRESTKDIKEINQPENVLKMFFIVSVDTKKDVVIETEKASLICL